ncbi:MAG: histidinol-phosphatase [Clostridia bacterium]|nr:histidinol-phosphatase [Clostridia bacterium]
MITCDYHVHTTYCDGKSTPEEVVKSAIAKGMTEIGFSGHSYTFFDESYCMTKEGTQQYIAEISALKEKYADKIQILCGIEQDYFAGEAAESYDYVIGSVHYVKVGDEYFSVDHTKDIFIDISKKCFGGDYYSFAESYYESVGNLASVHPDIIGHFDLITKFNENGTFFDESHPRYITAWKAAVDKLLSHNIPFEINTGAISRGYRISPYPSDDILSYISSKGGRFILASDSHSADNLLFGFDKIEEKIKSCNILKNI